MFAHKEKNQFDVIYYQPLYKTFDFIHHFLYITYTYGYWPPLLNLKMTVKRKNAAGTQAKQVWFFLLSFSVQDMAVWQYSVSHP